MISFRIKSNIYSPTRDDEELLTDDQFSTIVEYLTKMKENRKEYIAPFPKVLNLRSISDWYFTDKGDLDQVTEGLTQVQRDILAAERGHTLVDTYDISDIADLARGTVEISITRDKDQSFKFNIESKEDIELILLIIIGAPFLIREQIPAGYSRFFDYALNREPPNIFLVKIADIIRGEVKVEKEEPIEDVIMKAEKEKKHVEKFVEEFVEKTEKEKVSDYLKKREPPLSYVIRTIKRGLTSTISFLKRIKLLSPDQCLAYPSNFECTNYEHKQGPYCVPKFFLSEKFSNKKLQYLAKSFNDNPCPNYQELTDILNKISVGLNVFMSDGSIVQKQKGFRKNYKICVHNNHMYVIRSVFKRSKKRVVVDKDKYDDMYEYAINNTRLMGHNDNEFIYNDTKYLLKSTNFTAINKDYDLMSRYSKFNMEFYLNCGIRALRYYDDKLPPISKKTDILIDINKCYPNILMNPQNDFFITTGMERVTKYTGNIKHHNFYKVFMKRSKFTELFYGGECNSVWVTGKELKYLLNDILRIDGCVEARKARKGKKVYKKDKDGNITNKLKYTMQELREYSGSLAKYMTYNIRKYGITDRTEILAYAAKYGDQLSLADKYIVITKGNYKKKAGLFAYLNILSYCKVALMKIYSSVMKHYPDAKVKRIYSDCIAFSGVGPENKKIDLDIIRKDIYPITVKEEDIDEKKHNKTKGSFVKNSFSDVKWEKKKISVKRYNTFKDNKKIKDLIKNKKSFKIDDFPGTGKTYYVQNEVIPYMTKLGYNYISTSSTTENAGQWSGRPIQHYLRRSRGIDDICEFFKDIDYLICDEASQLNMDILCNMQVIKERCGTSFILIGDRNQCKSIDGYCYMSSEVFMGICDHNMVYVGPHNKMRFSRDYYKFLKEFIKNYWEFGIESAKAFVRDRLYKPCIKGKERPKLVLCYKHKVRKEFIKDYGLDARTIHSYQGKTIDYPYLVYIDDITDYRILYTAISRTVSEDNIYVI